MRSTKITNINDAEEEYFKLEEECCTYNFIFPLTIPQKNRRNYLRKRIIELEAIWFGNPNQLKICLCCKNKLTTGYLRGSGVYLENICPVCYRKGDISNSSKRNPTSIGNKHGGGK